MTQDKLTQLLASMTVEEKVLQLCQLDISFYLSSAASATGPMAEFNLSPAKLACIGSVLCGGNAEAEAFAKVQQQIVDQSPHHIPTVIMSDVIHGMRTIFPIPLGLASAFHPATVETMARVSAKEASASGIHVTFAPMADVSRNPRWGRCMESSGESVKLNADLSAATVRGFHGTSIANADSMACCMKHFAAYGLVQAGLEYMPVDVSRTELYNTYFPPFKATLEAGCDLVMPAFTPIDREPAVMNQWLMQTVLREQWGFDGPVISDWGAPAELLVHGIARDRKEAAKLCFDAGMDLDMMGMVYIDQLAALVAEGTIPMQDLDHAVLRVLTLKNDLGLFETPCKNTSNAVQEKLCTSKAHHQAALEAALQSCVLLQNNGALPLRQGQKIALAGNMAAAQGLLGGWAFGGRDAETRSLQDVFPEACSADDADIVLFATGEPQSETGEATSKVAPVVPPAQVQAIEALHAAGKKVVLLLFCGRPFIITELLPLCDAVLLCWFPGSEGAQAIRMLLTGEANPSGHLPMTFPRSIGQIPIHHDTLTTGRPGIPDPGKRYFTHYVDEKTAPLFPFGFGLSYTDFAYSDAAVSAAQLAAGETLTVTCTVQNTGNRHGDTVAQLYLACEHSPRMHPVRELKAYQRLTLQAGETRQVSLTLTAEDLMVYDAQGKAAIAKSRYLVAVGDSSTAPFTAAFTCR